MKAVKAATGRAVPSDLRELSVRSVRGLNASPERRNDVPGSVCRPATVDGGPGPNQLAFAERPLEDPCLRGASATYGRSCTQQTLPAMHLKRIPRGTLKPLADGQCARRC